MSLKDHHKRTRAAYISQPWTYSSSEQRRRYVRALLLLHLHQDLLFLKSGLKPQALFVEASKQSLEHLVSEDSKHVRHVSMVQRSELLARPIVFAERRRHARTAFTMRMYNGVGVCDHRAELLASA